MTEKKRGRGGDSAEALRRVWMEGYERGRVDMAREMATPIVQVRTEDLLAVYEPGVCAHPEVCPCTGRRRP